MWECTTECGKTPDGLSWRYAEEAPLFILSQWEAGNSKALPFAASPLNCATCQHSFNTHEMPLHHLFFSLCLLRQLSLSSTASPSSCSPITTVCSLRMNSLSKYLYKLKTVRVAGEKWVRAYSCTLKNSYLNTVLPSCLCLWAYSFFDIWPTNYHRKTWSKNVLNGLEPIKSSCTSVKG